MTLAVAGGLAWLWRSRASFPIKAAALAIGTILATPYSLDYDLMLLAPAIAFLAADGMQRGFRPWQKSLLAALWLVPILARPVAQATLIPLAVPAMLVAFVVAAAARNDADRHNDAVAFCDPSAEVERALNGIEFFYSPLRQIARSLLQRSERFNIFVMRRGFSGLVIAGLSSS